jgi:Domain of unknown function (DUF3859)
MLKPLIFVLFIGLFSSCMLEFEISSRAKDVRAKELNAGSCSSLIRKIKKNRASVSGEVLEVEFFRIQQSTDTVKAELGAQFGIEYIIFADNHDYVPLYIVWTFPEEIETDQGKRYGQLKFKTTRLSHQRTNSSYRLSKPCMLVKGEWKFQLYFKKELILEKLFYLV